LWIPCEQYREGRFTIDRLTQMSGDTQPTVVRSYNKRGTAEQWIKEGKQAMRGASELSSFPLRQTYGWG